MAIVLQEWWGLNDHMKKMTDCFADAGFLALAPDLYRGKVAYNSREAEHLMDGLDWNQALDDVKVASLFLKQNHQTRAVGVLGFCMGGALALAASCRLDRGVIEGGVCFYGIPPREIADPQAQGVCCPLQLHFAMLDQSKGFSNPEAANQLERTLRDIGTPHEFYRYPNVDHAFMNETRPEVYSPEASKLAFERACKFLRSLTAQ